MIEEIWKPVPEYENLYFISNLGNLKPVSQRPGNTRKILINLKPKLMGDGYLLFRLNKDNQGQKYTSAHKLVASVFLEKTKQQSQVNHKNFNKTDNRVENLEWCTPSENVRHFRLNGKINPPRVTLPILKENGLLPDNFEILKKI